MSPQQELKIYDLASLFLATAVSHTLRPGCGTCPLLGLAHQQVCDYDMSCHLHQPAGMEVDLLAVPAGYPFDAFFVILTQEISCL